jgi:sentrin-specific protease 7
MERLVDQAFEKKQKNAGQTPENPYTSACSKEFEGFGEEILDPRRSKLRKSMDRTPYLSINGESSSEVEAFPSSSKKVDHGVVVESEDNRHTNSRNFHGSLSNPFISTVSAPKRYRTDRDRGIIKPVDDDFVTEEMVAIDVPIERRWPQLHPDWSDQWKDTIFYQGKDNAKATVQKADVERLDEGVFLNDNLIEFYLRWLENRLERQNPETSRRVYLHNTFFFKRLTQNGKGRAIDYSAVERWTNKVDLISFDYIIVPVHENTHWYVAVICNPANLLHAQNDISERSVVDKAKPMLRHEPSIVEIFDSQDSAQLLDGAMDVDGGVNVGSDSHLSLQAPALTVDSSNQMNLDTDSESPPKKSMASVSRVVDTTQTRIITLDSLGGRHSPTCTKLRDYLVEEIAAKKGVRISPPGALGLTVKNLPRQQNDYDCGIFLLNYVEEFLGDPDGFYRKVLEGQSFDIAFRDASETRGILRDIILSMQR